MSKLTIELNPNISHRKVRLTFDDDLLLIEANKAITDIDMNIKTSISEYSYLYSKDIPLTESLYEIRTQLNDVDFISLFTEPQEFCGRTKHEIRISWGFEDVSINIKNVDGCKSTEAKRIHSILLMLFNEIRMEEYYVCDK